MFNCLKLKRQMSAQRRNNQSDAEESLFQPVNQSRDLKQSKGKFEDHSLNLRQMQIFIETITQKRVGIENNVIFNFCGKYEKMPIHSKNVLSLLEKRIERMMKNKKIKKNWSEDDLDILIWTTTYYAELHKIQQIEFMDSDNWNKISDMIPGTTGESCMFKILGLKKVRLSEQSWTSKQSDLLFQIVKNSQKLDWKKASQELFIRNQSKDKTFRSAKQCKEHWSCYLNPQLKKGPWMIDEDILLLDNILQNNGKKKWTELARIFQGRTQNALKNRFCLLVDKQRSSKDPSYKETDQISDLLYSLREQRRNLVKLNVIKDDPKLIPEIEGVPAILKNNSEEKILHEVQKAKEIQLQQKLMKISKRYQKNQFNLNKNLIHKQEPQHIKRNYKFNFALQAGKNQQSKHLIQKPNQAIPEITQKQVSYKNKYEELRQKPTSLKMQTQSNINIKIEPTEQSQAFQMIQYPKFNTQVAQNTNFYPFFLSYVMYNPMLP